MFPQKPYLWLHVASLGDLKATLSLQSHLSEDFHLYVSTVTSSGQIGLSTLGINTQQEICTQHPKIIPKSAPIYHPFSPYLAYHGLSIDQRPVALILEYLEVWPHWVYTWHRLGVKIIVVDGKITNQTLRFRWLLKPFFRKIDLFLAQSDQDASYAKRLGVDDGRIEVVGFGKYDSIFLSKEKKSVDTKATNQREILLTIACLAKDEESLLMHDLAYLLAGLRDASLMSKDRQAIKIYIAPRQIKRVKSIEQKLRHSLKKLKERDAHLEMQPCIDQVKIIKKSQMSVISQAATQTSLIFILVDCYGELEEIYAHSKYALIAGSFGKRNGQNLIEAMLQGAYLFVGNLSQKIEVEKQLLREDPKLGQEIDQMKIAFEKIADFEKRQIDCTPPRSSTNQAIQSLLGASLKQAQIIQNALLKGESH